MGSRNVHIHWVYRYYVFYLAWWWHNEPKHVAEFLILITNICCVYWLIKLLYYCRTQRGGSYQNIEFILFPLQNGYIMRTLPNLLAFHCSYRNCCCNNATLIVTVHCWALLRLVQSAKLRASYVKYRNPPYDDMSIYLIFFCLIATGIPRIAGPFNVAAFSNNSVTGW